MMPHPPRPLPFVSDRFSRAGCKHAFCPHIFAHSLHCICRSPPSLAALDCCHPTGLAYRDQVRAEISEIKAKQLLKEQDSTKRFAVQVAHDLGTPLQGLRLAFNLASTQHKVGSDFQENVSIMHTCINSLTQLREMMMDEAKSVNRERGRSVNRCDPVVSVCCNVRITQGFRFSCT